MVEVPVPQSSDSTSRTPKFIFLCLFLLANFHILRNIGTAALVLVVSLYGILATALAVLWFLDPVRPKLNIYLICALISVGFTFLVTAAYDGFSFAVTGGLRFAFCMPLLPASYYVLSSYKEILSWYKVALMIGLIASISIIWQVIYGPIAFFVEPTSRMGADRFASLYGSLTAFGTAVPLLIPFILISQISLRLKVVSICTLAIASVLSLQKAATSGSLFAIGVSILCLFNAGLYKRAAFTLCSTSAILIVVLSVSLLLPGTSDYLIASGFLLDISSLDAHGDLRVDSPTLMEDITLKVTVLFPEHFGFLLDRVSLPMACTFGAGYILGGGTLFPELGEDIPMSHSTFIDMFSIGGFPLLALFCLLLVKSYRQLGKDIRNSKLAKDLVQLTTALSIQSALIMFCVLSLFNSGMLFQPGCASIFWTICGALLRLSESRTEL